MSMDSGRHLVGSEKVCWSCRFSSPHNFMLRSYQVMSPSSLNCLYVGVAHDFDSGKASQKKDLD